MNDLFKPQMQPCAGRNCGSTNPNLHSAECFEDYEKATGMAQPEQEPVAWMFQHDETGRIVCVHAQQVEWDFEKYNPRFKKIAPLYTTPPQRKPLTWEQQMRIHNECGDSVSLAIALTEAAHGINGDA